jgi:hypothetical protein
MFPTTTLSLPPLLILSPRPTPTTMSSTTSLPSSLSSSRTTSLPTSSLTRAALVSRTSVMSGATGATSRVPDSVCAPEPALSPASSQYFSCNTDLNNELTHYSVFSQVVWVKPGGESDGTSDTSSVRYDSTCGLNDAKKPAPEAGTWFQAYFLDLVSFMYFPTLGCSHSLDVTGQERQPRSLEHSLDILFGLWFMGLTCTPRLQKWVCEM